MNAQAPRGGRAFPVEEFVQALSAQLDRAQDALALKARTGRPLTFAIKDLSIDLRVFWESDSAGRVLVRHAGPNEEGASTVHLNFTTITKEMVEENTFSMSMDEDPRGIQDLAGAGFSEQDRRRLELIGVRTVGQFRRLSADTDIKQVETYAGIPMLRLQAALQQAARPSVTSVEPVRMDGRQFLRVRGANLQMDEGLEVRLSGEPVEVLEATPTSLLVRPMSHHREGRVEVNVGGALATGFYDLLPPDFRAPAELRDPGAAARHAGETLAVPLSLAPTENGAEHAVNGAEHG